MAKLHVNPERLEVGAVTQTHAFGHFGGVLLVQWRTDVTIEGVRSLASFHTKLVASRKRVGALHIGEEGLSLPSAEVRADAELALSGVQRASALALVSAGTGFGASAVRSLGTAMFAMRSGPPTRLFSQVSEGVTFLLGRLPLTASHAELVRAVEQLRGLSP